MLPLFVLHFEDKVAADPEFIVHVDDIRRWEAEHGEIPAESFVAFSSGDGRRRHEQLRRRRRRALSGLGP